jgi:hypothetical protein
MSSSLFDDSDDDDDNLPLRSPGPLKRILLDGTDSDDGLADSDDDDDDDDDDNLSFPSPARAIKSISGVGTISYTNGNVYKGSYRSLFEPGGTPEDEFQPNPHGEGKLTNKNGKLVCEGVWVDGKLHLDDKTISVAEEEDTIYYKNGNIYRGAIENFKPHGVGTMTYACKRQRI